MHKVLFFLDGEFDRYLRGERYYRVHEFQFGDPRVNKFLESKARLRGNLSTLLTSLYGKKIFLPENQNTCELLEAVVEDGILSDDLIKVVLSFLHNNAPSYCVQLVLFSSADVESGHQKGKVAITLNRFGVSGNLKNEFKEKCRKSLNLGEWPITFSEAGK